MRRSKAPSMINKAKRICNTVDDSKQNEIQCSEPEDEQYNWGSKDHNGVEKVNNFSNKNKRIFNIVWRDVTTKKHKTWKGDGTLEVTISTVKAILKDETGKYMGCSTKFNINDLEPDFQMMIGGKEIEIQNEIKDEEEIYDLRKRQMKNRNWGAEEWISPEKQAEEEKKPKGGFKFKPILVLKQPELPKNTEVVFKNQENCVNDNWGSKNYQTEDNWNLRQKLTFDSHIHQQKPIVKSTLNENANNQFICFIRNSELQQFLFQQVVDYYNSIKQNISLEKLKSLDFKNVLLQICNHPSFVNHKSTTNELIQHIIPSLPEWSEMGPFDSGKLEFVQYFLNALFKGAQENCIIVAKHINTLNMLQGLCDFMELKCFRLNMNDSEEMGSQIFEELSLEKSLRILLVNSMEVLKHTSAVNLSNPKIIIFEDISNNMRILESLQNLQQHTIYFLITAFTIEELLLLDSQSTTDFMEELGDLSGADDSFCYLHTKMKCKCYENTKDDVNSNKDIKYLNWKHFTNPFDAEFLKISGLENAAENIVTIFHKAR